MNSKQATWELLDQMPAGARFTGHSLEREVRRVTHKRRYPGTILRYVRAWRENSELNASNIKKAKSLYEIQRD